MTSPIRVLVASHTYVVGANQAKLRALAATRRVEVGLLVPRDWRDRTLGLAFELEDATDGQVQVFPASIVMAGRVGGYVFRPDQATAALRRFRPDVLHVEAEVFSLVAFELVALGRAFGAARTLFCWENVQRDLGPRRVNARVVTASLAHLFAGSGETAEVVRRWGYRGEVTVVPQLGTEVRPDLQPRRPPEREPVIGYVGRLVSWKGVDLLLHALANLRDRGLHVRGVIVGTGPEEGRLRRLATMLGLAHHVTWHGWIGQDDVPEVLADVDVLVLPSRSIPRWREQFGHVLIEAMAEGMPVVGSSCGAIPDVIGRPDLVFPEGDWHALADLLFRVSTDPASYQAAARHSVDRVQIFTNAAIAQRMADAWETVLEHPARMRPVP